MPIYILVLEAVETVALYTTLFVRQGPFNGHSFFSSAVASLGACVVVSAKDLHFVALDSSFHIRHTTVAYFRSIPIQRKCGKCLSINLKSVLATLFCTFELCGD